MTFLTKFLRSWDRRRHARVVAPTLTIHIDGATYESVDWSLGGFRLSGYHNAVEKGDHLSGSIEYSEGAKGEFVAEIAVIYDRRSGSIGARFIEITPSVLIAMSGLGEL